VTNTLTGDGPLDGGMILRRLVAGAAMPVLVADFQAFSSAPRLSQLISDRAVDRPVYQVDPLDALSRDRRYISLADLAAEAAGSFARSQPADGPVFVIGYCSAAALSMHIARLLAPSREATAVLLRPSWPGNENIEQTFATLAANLGAHQPRCPELDGDPDRCVRRMEDLLRTQLEALAASQGLDGSAGTFGELLLIYRSWLAFLLACRNDTLAGWADGIAPVTVLTDTPGSVTVPGLSPGEFKVCPLPVTDEDNPVTPEVAELLVAQILFRFHSYSGSTRAARPHRSASAWSSVLGEESIHILSRIAGQDCLVQSLHPRARVDAQFVVEYGPKSLERIQRAGDMARTVEGHYQQPPEVLVHGMLGC